MPISTSNASERAHVEAGRWAELAGHWTTQTPTEQEVMVIYNPGSDLGRRAGEWGHQLTGHDLGSIALFAAALAQTEGDAWDDGTFDLALRAYEARRFLLNDRIIHWAVPWLMAVGGERDALFLLDLGDEMRVEPALTGREGLVVRGEDSFGPLDQTGGVWSGWVGVSAQPDDLHGFWTDLADDHPGTAQLWLDLATRARL